MMNLDRARGALLGLAVGDALGTTLEFTTPQVASFPTLLGGPHRDVTGGGPFHLAPGQVTDDTHMACCLAASLGEHGDFVAADVAARYVEWRKHTFDIGSTTSSAVSLLARGALDAGRQVWENSGRKGAANGSLMRTVPVGVFFWNDPARCRAVSFADCVLTHFDPRCQLACAAFNAVIARAIGGGLVREIALEHAEDEVRRAAKDLVSQDVALAGLVNSAADELLEDLQLAREDDPRLGSMIHSAQGFVRVAFRLAFWELAHAPTFTAGLIDVVNRGGDADTNGAIAGAVLGALHGGTAIPTAWKDRVLAALQAGPPSQLRDAYHPSVLLAILDGMPK